MANRPFTLPTWLPIAVLGALAVWAVSIWWMVATLPASAGSADVADPAETAALRVDVGLLTLSVETLTAEIDRLSDERAALEARIAILEVAPEPTIEVSDVALGPDEEDVTLHPLFTNGTDRYNCRDFASFAEAQEALRVNGPGDPNRIDMNRNGIACEDIPYPAATPTATPTADTP